MVEIPRSISTLQRLRKAGIPVFEFLAYVHEVRAVLLEKVEHQYERGILSKDELENCRLFIRGSAEIYDAIIEDREVEWDIWDL